MPMQLSVRYLKTADRVRSRSLRATSGSCASTRAAAACRTGRPREREVRACLLRGSLNAQIAARLFLSEKTVRNDVSASPAPARCGPSALAASHIFDKLGARSRAEAIVLLRDAGSGTPTPGL
jgi:DNA-binding NarL/FixJ family response regulator